MMSHNANRRINHGDCQTRNEVVTHIFCTETLEIRGINRGDILTYMHQMGGCKLHQVDIQTLCKEVALLFPIDEDMNSESTYFKGEGWYARISSESYFTFLQSIVPIVFVTFAAINEDVLHHTLSTFRLKTFRAGG